MAKGSRQRVLIVDDVQENIKVLIELLKPEYTTFFAQSGKRGLELAEKKGPDIILLDIVMPDMDGYQVCRKLKKNANTREIPVIFISAMTEVVDETKGLEVGAVDYITKWNGLWFRNHDFHPNYSFFCYRVNKRLRKSL